MVVSVSWRDGVHIHGTPLWCDANRPREVCFASRADAMPNAQHGQLIASAETLALLSRPGDRPLAALTPPYGRPFTLGSLRLELFRSGSALGASSLAVDVGGQRVVYAGAVHPSAEVRHCELLVLDAEYGDPRYEFPDSDVAAAEVAGFCREVTAANGVAVLLVRRLCKVFDVLGMIGDLPVLGHRSLVEPVRRMSTLTGLPALRRATARPAAGHVLCWPLAARAALSGLTLPAESRIALVSGRAVEPDFVLAAGANHGIPWADRMGHEALLGYIRASGAARVFAVGRGAEALLQAVPASCDGRELAPPQQMALF